MKEKQRPLLYLIGILAVLGLGFLYYIFRSPSSTSQAAANTQAADGERARVTYVYDGDTIEVEMNGDRWDVRYIGVDTPEREQPYYEEASQANLNAVKNKDVLLVKDVSDVDQYGRLLRYVYLTDGTFVNADLLRYGFARTINFPPDVANERYFASLQAEAQREGLGLWGLDVYESMPSGCNTCEKNAYDCADFSSQRQAQSCFEFCMDMTGEDVHHLDGGGDGRVCEALR